MMHVTDNDDVLLADGEYCFRHLEYVLIHHFILDWIGVWVCTIICVAILKKGLHQHTIYRALTPSNFACDIHKHRHTSSLKCFWLLSFEQYCWNAAHLHIELSLNIWYQYRNRNHNPTWMCEHVWFATFILYSTKRVRFFFSATLLCIIKIAITFLHFDLVVNYEWKWIKWNDSLTHWDRKWRWR